MADNDLAIRIVTELTHDLASRGGFDSKWSQMDTGTQHEITLEWHRIVRAKLAGWITEEWNGK